ncbi:MAG: 8-amino-7-oxononanoate synthase [Proteobacteria bacterium]|nr:8-amino-7-oxononanoate synthase [Pseudomonadota bacterium]
MSVVADLDARLAARRAGPLVRRRATLATPQGVHVVVDGEALVSFASNDYLGLAADPRLVAAASAAAHAWGTGAGASHLLSGHQSPHAGLERALATFCPPCAGAAAVTFATGYLANLGILCALGDRDTVVFADRFNHACLNDGALLARARLVRYAHNDADALAARLASTPARTRIIATDAVFSMDGDEAPLAALLALADEYDAWLVVDDAHGIGVLGDGRGSVAAAGLASPRIVSMVTFGKALGAAGAGVVAHPSVIDAIVQFARPYIYTTAAPAMLAATVAASLDIVRDDAPRRARLAANIARFRSAVGCLPGSPLALGASRTAIQPLVVGDSDAALALSRSLRERGFYVPAIRPPTVPSGTARLRVSLSAAHADADIDGLAAALAASIAAERAA